MGSRCARRQGVQSSGSGVSGGRSESRRGRRVLFVAGEDADAKKAVSDLAVKLGYVAIDLGGLEQSRLVQFPGGPLSIINLVQLNQ